MIPYDFSGKGKNMAHLTLGDLRKALEQIGSEHDHKKVSVWLPGSHIDLENSLILGEEIRFEGNIRAGSALEALLMEGL